MKIKFYFLLVILAIYGTLNAQDSAQLYFIKQTIKLPLAYQGSLLLDVPNLEYKQTILNIGEGKYFYIKQTLDDSLTVESGQLDLCKVSNKFYLLREGIWVLEDSTEKVLFQNFGKKGLLEEVQVYLDPTEFSGSKRKNRDNKTIRKVKN